VAVPKITKEVEVVKCAIAKIAKTTTACQPTNQPTRQSKNDSD
jgi:hypothetical protein